MYDRIGKYEIIELLGHGGQGSVYKAKDTSLADRIVALKIIEVPGGKSRSPLARQVLDRFEREAEITGGLNHPQIAQVFDYDINKENEVAWMARQYLDGLTLGKTIETKGPFDDETGREIILSLAKVLAYLHHKGIVHRDIKPSNIFIQNEIPVLIDFGLTYGKDIRTDITGTQALNLGTLGYLPPELFSKSTNREYQHSPARDWWGLGCTAFELFTGRALFDYDESSLMIAAMLQEQEKEEIDELLLDHPALPLVKGLLERDPETRIEFAADLTGEPKPVKKPQPKHPVDEQAPASPSGPIVVSHKSDGQFSKISEAVKNAPEGSRILIRPGLYNDSIVIDKKLEIIGDGELSEIIIESTDAHCMLIDTPEAFINGLTLRSRRVEAGDQGLYGTLRVKSGLPVIYDCDISSDASGCISVDGKANPTIRKCIIHNSPQDGISFEEHSSGLVEDCEIHDTGSHGICVWGKANLTIRRCRVSNCRDLDGFGFTDGATGLVEECEITDNIIGVLIQDEANPIIRNCIFSNCETGISAYSMGKGSLGSCDISKCKEHGIKVDAKSNLTAKGCKIHDCGKHGVVVTTNSIAKFENCDIYSNKSAGIGAVEQCEINLISCNIHNNDLGIGFLNNSKGSVKNCEIHDCDAGIHINKGSAPHITGTKIYKCGKTGVLIDNAKGNIENCSVSDCGSIGLDICNGADPVIKKVSVNKVKNAAIFFRNSAKGTIEECKFLGSEKSGIAVTEESDPSIRTSLISGNKVGVIFLKEGKGGLFKCKLLANSQNGIIIGDGCAPVIQECNISFSKLCLSVKKGNVDNIRNCKFQVPTSNTAPWVIKGGWLEQRKANSLLKKNGNKIEVVVGDKTISKITKDLNRAAKATRRARKK